MFRYLGEYFLCINQFSVVVYHICNEILMFNFF